MADLGVLLGLLGAVNSTLSGASMKEAYPWAHPSVPPSHPAGHCAPSSYRVPWPDVQPEPSPLHPTIGSLQWSSQGVDLQDQPCRLHRCTQN
jgi:hypothetical protein